MSKNKKILLITGGSIFTFFVLIVIVGLLNPVPAPPDTKSAQEQDGETTTVETSASQTQENIAPENRPNESVDTTQKVSQPSTTPTKPPQPPTSQYTYYSVISVVDGDTIKINLDGTTETLRLIGIDTPEILDPRKSVQCFGKEASNKAKELLSNKKVRIEKDSTQGDRDKYGRLLVYVWRDDGLFYNDHMIKTGYAHEYTYNLPYKYQVQFKASEKYARENQLGLWSPTTCNGDTTQSASSSTSNSSSTSTGTTTQTSSGKYYTSSYASSKYYYPESCDAWKSLSPSYLKVFNSLQELLAVYPSKTLSSQCQ